MSPLLSVVIPTHNRARYAGSAIRSILAIDDPRLELIVSDTSTDGQLAELIADGKKGFSSDLRLNYFRPQGGLDITGNHNAALGAARGEFVCLIGDDDTILADALQAASWANANEIDLIAPNVVASYCWPDFKSRLVGDGHAARLYFVRQVREAVIEDSKIALARSLENAAQGTDGLPRIYHGIVRRTLLESIRKCSGAYFHGSSPDVSGAIALALCSNSFLSVNYPLTIPGSSGGSNSGRSAMNAHKGTLSQEPQTKRFEAKGWSFGVPPFFSVETVWAHAALETIKKIDPQQVKSFNFPRLIAICKVLHPEFSSEIQQAISEIEELLECEPKVLAKLVSNQMVRYRWERALHFIKRLTKPTAAGGRSYISNLNTIAEAPPALSEYMVRFKVNWDSVVGNIKLR